MDMSDDYEEGYVDGQNDGPGLAEVRAIINLIKAGDSEEAILRLEREFWPKWREPDHSKAAYLFAQEAAGVPAVA